MDKLTDNELQAMTIGGIMRGEYRQHETIDKADSKIDAFSDRVFGIVYKDRGRIMNTLFNLVFALLSVVVAPIVGLLMGLAIGWDFVKDIFRDWFRR